MKQAQATCGSTVRNSSAGGGGASGRPSEGGGGLSAACQGASAKPVAGPNPPPALAHSVSQPGPSSLRAASPPQLPEGGHPGTTGSPCLRPLKRPLWPGPQGQQRQKVVE